MQPNIEMVVTTANQHGSKPHPHHQQEEDIQMVTMSYQHASTSIVDNKKDMVVTNLEGRLNTPVSGSNPSGNSANLYVKPPSSGSNPGGNSESLVANVNSGPNPGGNSENLVAQVNYEVLATPSGPNPGGNSANLVAQVTGSGSNPGGNSENLVAQVNYEVLATPSGPNPGGNSQILLERAKVAGSSHTEEESERERVLMGSRQKSSTLMNLHKTLPQTSPLGHGSSKAS